MAAETTQLTGRAPGHDQARPRDFFSSRTSNNGPTFARKLQRVGKAELGAGTVLVIVVRDVVLVGLKIVQLLLVPLLKVELVVVLVGEKFTGFAVVHGIARLGTTGDTPVGHRLIVIGRRGAGPESTIDLGSRLVRPAIPSLATDAAPSMRLHSEAGDEAETPSNGQRRPRRLGRSDIGQQDAS